MDRTLEINWKDNIWCMSRLLLNSLLLISMLVGEQREISVSRSITPFSF